MIRIQDINLDPQSLISNFKFQKSLKNRIFLNNSFDVKTWPALNLDVCKALAWTDVHFLESLSNSFNEKNAYFGIKKNHRCIWLQEAVGYFLIYDTDFTGFLKSKPHKTWGKQLWNWSYLLGFLERELSEIVNI